MLAATLGALLIATAGGVFGVISRSQRRASEVATMAAETARLREVIQASLRQIVATTKTKAAARPGSSTAVAQPVNPAGTANPASLSPEDILTAAAGGTTAATATTPPPGAKGTLPVGKEAAAKVIADAKKASGKPGGGRGAAEEDDTMPPRVLLERDSAGGGQRLELVVAGSPWSVRVRDGTSILPMPEAGGGVRGAFELRPDTQGPGLAMYWRVFALGDGPAAEREALGEARICGGISTFAWELFKTNESTGQLEGRADLVARTPAKLPAYAEVKARFVDGSVVNWMFEVAYVVGREQDTLPIVPATLAARLADARAAGTDTTNPTGIPVVNPGPGTGGPSATGRTLRERVGNNVIDMKRPRQPGGQP